MGNIRWWAEDGFRAVVRCWRGGTAVRCWRGRMVVALVGVDVLDVPGAVREVGVAVWRRGVGCVGVGVMGAGVVDA